MAANAGTVSVRVVPDISGFTEELLDALAEKVAAKIIENNTLVRAEAN